MKIKFTVPSTDLKPAWDSETMVQSLIVFARTSSATLSRKIPNFKISEALPLLVMLLSEKCLRNLETFRAPSLKMWRYVGNIKKYVGICGKYAEICGKYEEIRGKYEEILYCEP